MSTLVLWFHPEHDRSHAGKALVEAAAQVEGVEVVNMTALYPDGAIDVEAEVARLLAADRLILQFPIHWYLPPPLLAAWQNTVLTRMFYVNAKDEGARLDGLPVMIAATAGNVPEAYAADGVNLFPLDELLRPLQSTAHRCGWRWADPYLVFHANRLDADGLAAAASGYVARIAGWAETLPGRTG